MKPLKTDVAILADISEALKGMAVALAELSARLDHIEAGMKRNRRKS